jgi:hypothetical protein
LIVIAAKVGIRALTRLVWARRVERPGTPPPSLQLLDMANARRGSPLMRGQRDSLANCASVDGRAHPLIMRLPLGSGHDRDGRTS